MFLGLAGVGRQGAQLGGTKLSGIVLQGMDLTDVTCAVCKIGAR
jgi:hypothetical protein